MKTKTIKLDVDFIGGQEGLTEQEEKALSDNFKQRKQAAQKPKIVTNLRTIQHKKTAL